MKGECTMCKEKYLYGTDCSEDCSYKCYNNECLINGTCVDEEKCPKVNIFGEKNERIVQIFAKIVNVKNLRDIALQAALVIDLIFLHIAKLVIKNAQIENVMMKMEFVFDVKLKNIMGILVMNQ